MEAIFVEGLHDYNYVEEVTDSGVIHLLFRSDGAHWTSHCRGEELLSITDTGDGFIFNHGKPKKEMDYSYSLELSILLKKIVLNDYVIEVAGKRQPL
jgi:hypothetical protein